MRGRICICGSQVPFVRGGAESLYDSLRDELRRRGFEAEVVTLPFSWSDRIQILKSGLAWRLVNLDGRESPRVDLVIATRFPSYLVKHPNKVVWLIHQYRQAYDLLGTPYSDFGTDSRDRRVVEMIRAMDRRALGEARSLFSISRNTAERLERFVGLEAEPLYPPPLLGEALRGDGYGDYVLGVGRLDALKRWDLLVRAMAATRSSGRALIAGEGPEQERLARLIADLGLGGRVELLGRVSDERLLDLYAEARAVFYAPFDEDYGYVTVEAFKAARPVVTTTDAGGVREFVSDGETGFVCPPDAIRQIASRLDRLAEDEELARRLGERGRERVREIGWDQVIDRLTQTL